MSAAQYREIQERLEALELAAANLIRWGTVAEVNHAAGTVRVQLGEKQSAWLPWVERRAGDVKTWCPPTTGEQVILFAPQGHLPRAVALAGVFSTENPAQSDNPDASRWDFDDGAVIEYDKATHHLKAVLPNGATTEFVSTGGFVFDGDIEHKGEFNNTDGINSDSDITDHTRSMAGDRVIYNGHDHTGDSGGKTSPPGALQ